MERSQVPVRLLDVAVGQKLRIRGAGRAVAEDDKVVKSFLAQRLSEMLAESILVRRVVRRG